MHFSIWEKISDWVIMLKNGMASESASMEEMQGKNQKLNQKLDKMQRVSIRHI